MDVPGRKVEDIYGWRNKPIIALPVEIRNSSAISIQHLQYQARFLVSTYEAMSSIVSQIDELSSTQLYMGIVLATVGLCVVLIGPGGDQNLPSLSPKRQPRVRVTQEQQPKWHLFKWINVVVFGMFAISIISFLWNASRYIHSTVMIQFLVAWSLCFCYFFGFFAISFIHQDISEPEEKMGVEPSLKDEPPRYVFLLKCWLVCFIACFCPLRI